MKAREVVNKANQHLQGRVGEMKEVSLKFKFTQVK